MTAGERAKNHFQSDLAGVSGFVRQMLFGLEFAGQAPAGYISIKERKRV